MKRLLMCALLLVCAMPLAGAGLAPVEVLNLRSRGMGGAYLAVVDDQYSVVQNPAGPAILRLERKGRRWLSLVQPGFALSADFLGFWNNKEQYLALGSGSFEITNDMWNDLVHMKLAMTLSPVYFALVNLLPFNLNIAVFDTLKTSIRANPDIPMPSFDVEITNDLVAVLNLGLPLLDFKHHHYLYAGINAKIVQRTRLVKERADIFDLASTYPFQGGNTGIEKAIGLGFDAGLIYAIGRQRQVKFTLTATDIGTTKMEWSDFDFADLYNFRNTNGDVDRFIPDLHFGASFYLGTLIPVLMYNILLAVDYRDILDSDMNPFLKVYAGFEFHMLGVLRIRGGLYRGWLSAGVGIDIPLLPLQIDIAYWGEELGVVPGQNRVDNFGINLNLVW